MPEDDPKMGGPQGSDRQDIFPFLFLVSHGAHDPGDADPPEKGHDQYQDHEAGHHKGGDDDDHVKEGDIAPDFNDPLEKQVEFPPEIAHGTAQGNANGVIEQQQNQGKNKGGSKTIDQTGQDIPAHIVCAQKMPGGEGGGKGGILIKAQIVFIGVVWHQGHENKVLSLFPAEFFFQLPVIGFIPVFQAKGRSGNHPAIGGKIELPFIRDHKGPGIDPDFCRKRKKNQGQQNDKGPEAPGYGPESFHFLQGHGIQGDHDDRAS